LCGRFREELEHIFPAGNRTIVTWRPNA